MKRIVSSALTLCLLAACQQAPDPKATSAEVEGEAQLAWTFEAAAPALKAASCPPGTANIERQLIEISVSAVSLGDDAKVAEAMPDGVTFVAGWRLESDQPGFGGLSGLAVTMAGDLLMVSDAGAFIEVGMSGDAPSGAGTLAYLLDAEGKQLSSKEAGDAEGLALKDGVAIVSFEQEFRILAFDLGACGAAARGALIGRLPQSIDGSAVRPNNGPEALELTPQGGLLFGYERDGKTGAVRGQVQGDGSVAFVQGVQQPRGYSQVGLANGGAWTLYRSYDPVRGNRNIVDFGDGRALRLASPLLVDNFEGIAAGPVTEGVQRLWLISDDNFSSRQQTLLYAFDVTAPSQ